MDRVRLRARRMLRDSFERFKNWVFGRREAYRDVFDPRRPTSLIVLRDLAERCYAHETTMSNDPRDQAARESLRGLWLHIQHQINLTDEQLWELYGDGNEL